MREIGVSRNKILLPGDKMEGNIHTLQEYMFHTESITYFLIVGALVAITLWYRFLTDRDDDEK